jgi:hypothetical protein
MESAQLDIDCRSQRHGRRRERERERESGRKGTCDAILLLHCKSGGGKLSRLDTTLYSQTIFAHRNAKKSEAKQSRQPRHVRLREISGSGASRLRLRPRHSSGQLRKEYQARLGKPPYKPLDQNSACVAGRGLNHTARDSSEIG